MKFAGAVAIMLVVFLVPGRLLASSAPPSMIGPGGKPELGDHPRHKEVVDLLTWYRRNGYTVSDVREVDEPNGNVKTFHCAARRGAKTSMLGGVTAVSGVIDEIIDFHSPNAYSPAQNAPVPPKPPAPPPPALSDAGVSSLNAAKATHADVDTWLAHYRGAGYVITDNREEDFPTGKIKYFHCTGKKWGLLGSKTI